MAAASVPKTMDLNRGMKMKMNEFAICRTFVKDVKRCSACLHWHQCKKRGRPTLTAMAIKDLIDSLPVLRGKMDILSESRSKVEILPALDEESEEGVICVAKVSVKIGNVWRICFVPILYGEDPEYARDKILNIVVNLNKEGLRR